MNMTWSDIGTVTAAGSVILGVLFWALRGRLGNDFVTKAAHDEMSQRLGKVEQRLQLSPSHADFTAIVAQVSQVSKDVARIEERTDGLKESLARIERQLTLFVQARLEWEKAQ